MKITKKYRIILISIFYFSILAEAESFNVSTKKQNILKTFDFESSKEVDNFASLHEDAKTVEEGLSENDIEITANKIIVSNTGANELYGEGNIRAKNILANFQKAVLILKKKEKGNDFLLHLQDDVRINSNNENIIYAKSLLYGSDGEIHIQNARLITPTGASLIARDVTNGKKNTYLFREGIFTSCTISPQENILIYDYVTSAPKISLDTATWEQNKKQSNYNQSDNGSFILDTIISPVNKNKYTNYEIIPKNKTYKEIENNFEDIYQKYRWSEWQFAIRNGIYNTKSGKATFNHTTLRMFDIPIFYFPRLVINLKDASKPKTGLLPVQAVIIGGGSELGVIIPWYWRVSHNKDFLFTANIFENISSITGANLKPNATFDSQRYMASFYKFEYQHLISKKDDMLSKYSLKGSITNPTQTVDYNTKQAVFNQDGSYQVGYRGHFRSKAIFSLSPTTTINHRFLWISDPNYSLYYMRKYLPYHTNITSIQNVKDRSFNNLEIISWTPMLLNYQIETTPAVVTQGSSFWRTKKDSLGGYGFTDNQASYLSRSQGYSRVMGSSEWGYNINRIAYGTMLGFNNSFRGNLYNSYYNYGASLNPNQQIVNSSLIIFGDYANMLGNSNYIKGSGAGFGSSTLFSSQLIANHPLYQSFKYGTWIIDPMVSWQNNFGNNYGFFTNENSFTSHLTFDNLFEKNINNGVDGYTNGSRVSFGVKTSFITLNGYQISYGGGLMETITNFGNNYYLPIQSGIYSNGLSNYVGMFSITTPSGRITLSNNHRFDISNGNLLELYTNLAFIVIDKFLTINITHSYIDKSILFLQAVQQYNAQMITLRIDSNITKNIMFQFFGTQSIGQVNNTYYNNITNSIVHSSLDNPWLSLGINILYTSGCIEYGITANKSVISVPGASEIWTVGGSFRFSGI